MQNADIGQVANEGGASFQGPNLTILGSGAGMAQGGDSFHYVWQTNQGDYSIHAKVAPSDSAQGAIVIRKTEDPNSEGIWLGFGTNGKIVVLTRSTASGTVTRSEFDAGGNQPIWLQAKRSAGQFILASSEDGIEWETFHQVALSLSDRTLAGFAIAGTQGSVVFEGHQIVAVVDPASLVGENGLPKEPETKAQSVGTANVASSGNAANGDGSSNSSQEVEERNRKTPSQAKTGRVARKLFVNKLLGSDTNDGMVSLKSGARGPKKSIQAALALAGDGDEIVIASGTYSLTEISASGDITITPVGEVILAP